MTHSWWHSPRKTQSLASAGLTWMQPRKARSCRMHFNPISSGAFTVNSVILRSFGAPEHRHYICITWENSVHHNWILPSSILLCMHNKITYQRRSQGIWPFLPQGAGTWSAQAENKQIEHSSICSAYYAAFVKVKYIHVKREITEKQKLCKTSREQKKIWSSVVFCTWQSGHLPTCFLHCSFPGLSPQN